MTEDNLPQWLKDLEKEFYDTIIHSISYDEAAKACVQSVVEALSPTDPDKGEREIGFMQGYACAVATLYRMEGGISTQIQELWEANKIEPSDFDNYKIDEFDREVLIHFKRRNQK